MNEIKKELDYLIKYYRLERMRNYLRNNNLYLYELAEKWLSERTFYWTPKLRNRIRMFLLDYYRDHYLIIDNPQIGGGLSWHIQNLENDNKAYCGQYTAYDLTFHDKITVQSLINDKSNRTECVFSICEKCIKSYLRKRKNE